MKWIYNKKWTGVMAGAVLLSAASSCSDSFLKENLTTERNTEYFNTNKGLEELEQGLYYGLRWQYAFEWGFTMYNYGTDEYICGSDGSNTMWNSYVPNLGSAITTININTTNAYDLWNSMYTAINNANLMLEKLEKYTGTKKSELSGVAHFIRGYDYFKLVCQYGGVPIKLKTSSTVEREFTRATPKEVCEQIITDLTAAYGELPASDNTPGKLTKSAAAHFLAKAYLWRASELNDSWNADTKAADLDQVIKYAGEVIAAHPLAANYSDLWNYTKVDGDNEKLPEIVLSAQFTNIASTSPTYGNDFHLYFIAIYRDLTGMSRDIAGGREYCRLRTTYYTYNVFDHLNDSRLWKSYRTKLNCTKTASSGGQNYVPGDRGVEFILNRPGDTRFSAVLTKDTWKDGETGKAVPNVFCLYPAGSKEGDNIMESDTWMKYYACNSKYLDGSRPTVSWEKGYRDGILARSAEDYFFIAEAYIRKGDYARATQYLNTIRQRGAWKAGEDREGHVDGGAAWKEGSEGWSVFGEVAGKGTYCNRSTYYESNNVPMGSLNANASDLTVNDISTVSSLPAEDQAVVKKLGLTKTYDVAMCFLLNEKTREMSGELLRWEDLARTKTLVSRAKAFNKDAAPNIDEHHYLRPIPQTYLDIIQKDGHALTKEEKTAMQNPGY